MEGMFQSYWFGASDNLFPNPITLLDYSSAWRGTVVARIVNPMVVVVVTVAEFATILNSVSGRNA
jgi:hypothetical protein